MQRIRTLAAIPFEIPVSTTPSFKYQEVSKKAKKLRKLGMSYRKIGVALQVDEKIIRKALKLGL